MIPGKRSSPVCAVSAGISKRMSMAATKDITFVIPRKVRAAGIKMADLEQVVFETIRAQMCPALGIDSNKDKLDLQTVQQTEHEEKLRSIQDSKRYLYEQYALGEIDLETYRTRKAVYDTELVQAKNVHAVITAQTKQIKRDYEIKLKQQEIVQKVGNANMLTKALIDRLINKVYVFPGDRIEIEYATQDFLETKESEKEV